MHVCTASNSWHDLLVICNGKWRHPKDFMATLQGTVRPYPTLGSSENHRLKSAGLGKRIPNASKTTFRTRWKNGLIERYIMIHVQNGVYNSISLHQKTLILEPYQKPSQKLPK